MVGGAKVGGARWLGGNRHALCVHVVVLGVGDDPGGGPGGGVLVLGSVGLEWGHCITFCKNIW